MNDLGMVVNKEKTEIMWLGKDPPITSIKVGGVNCDLVTSMKVLGTYFECDLNWDKQAELSIKKGVKLINVFRFIRRYLTEEQFLKSVTSNYYGSVFYGASVWLPNIKASHKTKLNSLHFRLLRVACKDFSLKLSRDDLTTRCKRAKPMEWARYSTASIAMKTIRDELPKPLFEILKSTYYEERRQKGRGLFFDSSRRKCGRQSLQNRLSHVAQIKKPWNEDGLPLSNNQLRRLLKSAFFSHHIISGVVAERSVNVN